MITIALRTLFVYLILMLFLRLLGKRQVGQMQVQELVAALLLSELATFPITDPDIPLICAVLPVLLIVLCELLSACLCAVFPSLKKLIEGAPAILIEKGELNQKELARCRLSPDELLAQLRLKEVPDFTTVDYAVLEQSGQLSVVLKNGVTNSSAQPLRLPLIVNGTVHKTNLARFLLSEDGLAARLKGRQIKDVLLYSATEGGGDHVIMINRKI